MRRDTRRGRIGWESLRTALSNSGGLKSAGLHVLWETQAVSAFVAGVVLSLLGSAALTFVGAKVLGVAEKEVLPMSTLHYNTALVFASIATASAAVLASFAGSVLWA